MYHQPGACPWFFLPKQTLDLSLVAKLIGIHTPTYKHYQSGQVKFELKMPQTRELLLRANFKHIQAISIGA
jgi:hypothetical protein